MSRFITQQLPQKQYSNVISLTSTQDYAIPSYLRQCSVFVLAGGGGGGGGGALAYDSNNNGFAYGGNGGACGEFIRIDFNDLYSLGSTLKSVIGAGGAGGSGGAASAGEGTIDKEAGADGADGSNSSISINGFKIQAKGGAGGTLGAGNNTDTNTFNTAVPYTFTEIGDKNDYYSYIIESLNLSQIIKYGSVGRGIGVEGAISALLALPDPVVYHPLISDSIQPFIGSYFNISGTLIDTIGGYASGADGDSILMTSVGGVGGYVGGGVSGSPSAIANSPSNATADGAGTYASASGAAGGAGADGAANTGVGGGGGGGSVNTGSSSNPKTATGGDGGDGGSGKIIILY